MGMFSMLPVSKEQVLKLRDGHAIYMADSGRFNVLGMADDAIDRLSPPWSRRWTASHG